MSETSISLFDSFSFVPDPRSALGKRHPLCAILTLCSVAMLCGCRSLYSIAQFGRERGRHFAAALGFSSGCAYARLTRGEENKGDTSNELTGVTVLLS